MLRFKKRIWRDRLDAIRLYYKKPRFAAIDLFFGLIALFTNPYRACRKFLQKKGIVLPYGETPFTTYQRMVEICEIGPNDIWVELGSGRGKGCFWLAQFVQCRCIGVELVPQFVWAANLIKFLFRVRRVSFIRQDIEKVDLSKATVIYLYGIWPSLRWPPGIKVITISEPLESLKLKKSFWVRFPWGRTQAFLQES